MAAPVQTAQYTLLRYRLADNYLERRPEYRAAHLAAVGEARTRGELGLAGALSEPCDEALLVFTTADESVARRFAESDPYVMNGLVESWEVRSWTVVL